MSARRIYMKRIIPLIFLVGGFFLFLDRFLKWQAQHAWGGEQLVNRFFGWSPFFNDGIAFSLPVPERVTVIITIPIIFIVGYLVGRELFQPSPVLHAGRLCALVLILSGAASNLVDRILYHTTIDYLRLFTGVINLADILIVSGFVVYFWALRKQS